jgi:hypothetical protein
MLGDDGHRASHELVEGPGSSTIQRHVRDGRRFRVVKVPLEPRSLERSLRELGWVIEVKPLAGPFFLRLGGRAASGRAARPVRSAAALNGTHRLLPQLTRVRGMAAITATSTSSPM